MLIGRQSIYYIWMYRKGLMMYVLVLETEVNGVEVIFEKIFVKNFLRLM